MAPSKRRIDDVSGTEDTSAVTKKPNTSTSGSSGAVDIFNTARTALQNEIRRLKDMEEDEGKNAGINTDTYANAATRFLPFVRKLSDMEGAKGTFLAFHLLLFLADNSNHDLLGHSKQYCSYGDSQDCFQLMDAEFFSIIERRLKQQFKVQKVGRSVEVLDRYTDKLQMSIEELQKTHPTLDRETKRQFQRMQSEDWITSTLNELETRRAYFEENDLDGWFPKSIAKLKSLQSGTRTRTTRSLAADSSSSTSDDYNFSFLELLRTPSQEPQTSQDQYATAVKAIKARAAALSRNAQKGRQWLDITTDDWASAAAQSLPTVRKFSETEGCFTLAWNLLMEIADNCYSVEDHKHSSGYGDSQTHFNRFDDLLLSFIQRRLVEDPVSQPDNDWVTTTYKTLKHTKDYLFENDVPGYFTKSITQLWNLMDPTTNPQKMFDIALETFKKDIRVLGTKVPTIYDHATAVAKQTPVVQSLAALEGGFSYAWKLTIYLLDHCHPKKPTKISKQFSNQAFRHLDGTLLALIQRRVEGEQVGRVDDDWIRNLDEKLDKLANVTLLAHGVTQAFVESLCKLEELRQSTRLTAANLAKLLASR